MDIVLLTLVYLFGTKGGVLFVRTYYSNGNVVVARQPLFAFLEWLFCAFLADEWPPFLHFVRALNCNVAVSHAAGTVVDCSA